MKRFSSILAAMVLLFVFSAPAFAHKAMLFAEVKDGKVEAKAYYYKGAPMKEARFRVYDEKGTQLLEGKTDQEGKFSFEVPKGVESLKLEVKDMLGHRAEITMGKEELEKKE
jgi:nickel transport protein